MSKPADSLVESIQRMESEIEELRQYKADVTDFLEDLWLDVNAIVQQRLVEDTGSWFYSERSWTDYRESIERRLPKESLELVRSLANETDYDDDDDDLDEESN